MFLINSTRLLRAGLASLLLMAGLSSATNPALAQIVPTQPFPGNPLLYDSLTQPRVVVHARDLGWDHKGQPYYAPIQGLPNKHTLFAACGLWLGGFDAGGNLHVASQTYEQTGIDQFTGPVANSYGANYFARYNRVWKVTQAQLANHAANYNNFGYIMPSSIATWPGNGLVANGEPAIVAPFHDLNANGLYEPQLGDMPQILGDEAIYSILNDAAQPHTHLAGSLPLGVDIHRMVYTVNQADTALNRSVFVSYRVVNRGTNDYSNMRMALWLDADIGYFQDDFAGCDVEYGFTYTYNGDTIDDFPTGFGGYAPLQGLARLGGLGGEAGPGNPGIYAHHYYNNDFSTIGNVELENQVYNYMDGRWKDSTLVTFGGNGYGPGTPTRYMFPGDTDPAFPGQYWSETSAGNNPGDRRSLTVMDLGTLLGGQCVALDFALFTVVRPYDSAGNFSLVTPRQHVDRIRNHYNNALMVNWFQPCGFAAATPSSPSALTAVSPISVYPQPSPQGGTLRFSRPVEGSIQVVDMRGRVLRSVSSGSHSELNLAGLASGVYALQIMERTGSQAIKVVVE